MHSSATVIVFTMVSSKAHYQFADFLLFYLKLFIQKNKFIFLSPVLGNHYFTHFYEFGYSRSHTHTQTLIHASI